MFVPVILGSDKTTVSVGTGQNDYYPLYVSLGNVHNQTQRGHRNAVALVGFLSIPKSKQCNNFTDLQCTNQHLADKEHESSAQFLQFRRQLFHSSLTHILMSLKPWMTTPRVTRCADGHWRWVIYGLGPYIADYPEQALLSCVVGGWCAK